MGGYIAWNTSSTNGFQGTGFKIKSSFYKHGNPHYNDKMVSQEFDLKKWKSLHQKGSVYIEM